ncbi:MAG: phage portal protein [Oscillospiraceae bacterium]|nr:phage portal protein [Oscillospiraceae bacterium]
MGLFKKNQTRAEPKAEITPPIDDVLLEVLLRGETITREKALSLPAVSGAVDFIANCVACMPVRLFKRKTETKDGKQVQKIVEVIDDSRVRCLNGDTGDTLDGFQMKKAVVEDYLLGKGGYIFIRRHRNDVTGLFYVSEENIVIDQIVDRPIFKSYTIQVDGNSYEPFQFVKVLRNTKDGASGTGLVVEVSKAIEAAYHTLLYQLFLAQSGGNKKGFLLAERKLGKEEITALREAWKNLYGNNSEKVIVLNNGVKFQEAAASSVEMQINESRRAFAEEISNLFRISDDFEKTFKFAIYPVIKAFETALNRDLLLEREKRNHFFVFDVKEIVKANLRERYEAYRVAKETGFLTINEIRREENLEYIPGMDVINVGLSAVLFDVNTGIYYTPNTGQAMGAGETVEENVTITEEGNNGNTV